MGDAQREPSARKKYSDSNKLDQSMITMRKWQRKWLDLVDMMLLYDAKNGGCVQHLKAYALIYLGLVIYLLFYLSALKTGWFDIFFSGAALHVGAKGIDFYQVPRGAWAFWHGGSMTGDALPDGSMYAKDSFSNPNVYHPLFTLIIGSLLMSFNPTLSPYIWLAIKFVLSLLTIGYFYWSFRTYKYVQFATFLLLANFSIYLELETEQFQFVLNIFLLLFLINVVKNRSTLWSGMFYALGLLVKPIGALFVFALLFKRHWRIVALGLALFIGYTVLFLKDGVGSYYVTNLLENLLASDKAGPNQIITLNALLRFSVLTNWPNIAYKIIQYAALLGVIFLGSRRQVHISKAIFFMVVYYLCFYEQVFEYQWSCLSYVLAVCVVLLPEFQTRFSLSCCLLICLPSCFVLLRLWHIDVQDAGWLGLLPGEHAWELMVVSKLLPLFLLCGSVLVVDIKPLISRIKRPGKLMKPESIVAYSLANNDRRGSAI
jgi:hypothetical protein